ncbi:uncharacterized protein LOC117297722 [Asterias rubens]|uniref:uncharacterized protein LOC117297722 n=1 Tax=Asterias rubens TaxID=7604 RepID=UPI0014557E41|nr:uncharacterized protein LOC117297722 [Asterias rubens]
MKDLLNLDLSLYWEPPDDVSSITTYTVACQEKKTWRSIPHCTNITKTECTGITDYLIAEYGADLMKQKLLTKSYYLITRLEQPLLVEKSSASFTVEVFPYDDATISAPAINISELTSDSIKVVLLAPETLFYDSETQQHFRMDDKRLGGISVVYFNYTLWNIPGDVQDATKVYEEALDDIKSNVVSLSEITPYTLYMLAVSARIGKRYSKDNSTLIFRTKEAAPYRSPALLTPFDEELDCNNLNSRDVHIKWKAPAKEYWNGRSIHYEVRLHRVKGGDENMTSIVIMNVSSTSTTVRALSRLDNYDIVVYANNLGGGIPSSHRSLPGADSGFKPEDLNRRDSSLPAKIIEWRPPSGYEECSFEYRVLIESDGQTVWQTDVKNATFLDISDLEPGSYVAKVSVITKGRNYVSDYGLPASLLLNVAQSKKHQVFIPLAVGLLTFTLLVLMATCHVIKSQRSSMTFSSLDPFLRKAFSQTYSPTRYRDVEKETFDTPRIHLKYQGQEEAVACEETSPSLSIESTESTIRSVEDSIAVSRVQHVVSNQPLKPHYISSDDDTDDDRDAEHDALIRLHIDLRRPACGETKPEVPPSGDDRKPTNPTEIKQPQHESFEKNIPLKKISNTSFDYTPSSPNGIGLGYTVLANMFTLK